LIILSNFRVFLCFWGNFPVFFLANCLLISLHNNRYFVRCQLVSELQHFLETSSSSVSMAGGCGQVPNEEAPHRDRNVQDVMIENLQRQVAELAQRLAAQEVGNLEMENSNSDSTFENLYHNPAPYWEHRGRDEEFVDEEFQEDEFVDEEFIHEDVHDDVEHEDVEDPSQGFVDWDSSPIYDIDIMDEDLMGDSLSYDQEKKFVVDLDWISLIICDDIYPDEEHLLNEVSLLVDEIKFIEENNDYHVFDESPHNEEFQWSNKEISYVDFIGIERFLSNSPSNKLDVGFGVLAENFNFCGQERIDNSLKTFMECEFEKINEKREKIDLFQFSVRLVVVMGCN
jgi:hypothetical protein